MDTQINRQIIASRTDSLYGWLPRSATTAETETGEIDTAEVPRPEAWAAEAVDTKQVGLALASAAASTTRVMGRAE